MLPGAILVMPVLVNAAEFDDMVDTVALAEGNFALFKGLEAHWALEPDLVLVESDRTNRYLHNLLRDTKVRQMLENVTVIGDLDDTSSDISVTELCTDDKTVSSWEQQIRSASRFTALATNKDLGQ